MIKHNKFKLPIKNQKISKDNYQSKKKKVKKVYIIKINNQEIDNQLIKQEHLQKVKRK